MITCGVFKVYEEASLPILATEQSACYDLCAYLKSGITVDYYNYTNVKQSIELKEDGIDIYPGYRYLIPSGIKFKIPVGYSVRLHPRSGLSLKKGLKLVNSEAIIDSDFYHQTMILIYNNSHEVVNIKHGERVCQVEVVERLNYEFEEIFDDFGATTSRNGGLGHTGT